MPTDTIASTTDTAGGVEITTEDVKTFVRKYLSDHYKSRQLDQMCASATSRELAAMEVCPDHRASQTDEQHALAKYLKRNFSPRLSCWRSLVREVLADRQLSRTGKSVSA